MRKKRVCEQRVALDMIKQQPDNGGLSSAEMFLHEKQCKDFEKMDARITNIEKKVDNVDKKVDNVDKKVDTVVVQIQTLMDVIKTKGKEVGIYEKTLNSPNGKYVIIFLIIFILLLGAFFGVHISEEVEHIMVKGG